ncbi:hypothetical protein BB560_005598, partial [Smittium megazygosporum]
MAYYRLSNYKFIFQDDKDLKHTSHLDSDWVRYNKKVSMRITDDKSEYTEHVPKFIDSKSEFNLGNPYFKLPSGLSENVASKLMFEK